LLHCCIAAQRLKSAWEPRRRRATDAAVGSDLGDADDDAFHDVSSEADWDT
jgi:hypothetical protein